MCQNISRTSLSACVRIHFGVPKTTNRSSLVIRCHWNSNKKFQFTARFHLPISIWMLIILLSAVLFCCVIFRQLLSEMGRTSFVSFLQLEKSITLKTLGFYRKPIKINQMRWLTSFRSAFSRPFKINYYESQNQIKSNQTESGIDWTMHRECCSRFVYLCHLPSILLDNNDTTDMYLCAQC